MNEKTSSVPETGHTPVSLSSFSGNASTSPNATDFAVIQREQAQSGTDASRAWDEAFVRVQSYFRAYQIESALLLNRLTTEIIEEARALDSIQPGLPPVTLAMQTLQKRMANWFRETLEDGGATDARFQARGRLSLLMSKLAANAPQEFLSQAPVPAAVADSLKISQLQPGPEVRLSKMPPAELAFGFGDSDELPAPGKWAVHPAVGMCVVIAGAMGAAWAATH